MFDVVLLIVCATNTYNVSTANATSASASAIAEVTPTTVLSMDNTTSTVWHEGYNAGYAAALAAMRMGRNASITYPHPHPEPYHPHPLPPHQPSSGGGGDGGDDGGGFFTSPAGMTVGIGLLFFVGGFLFVVLWDRIEALIKYCRGGSGEGLRTRMLSDP